MIEGLWELDWGFQSLESGRQVYYVFYPWPGYFGVPCVSGQNFGVCINLVYYRLGAAIFLLGGGGYILGYFRE